MRVSVLLEVDARRELVGAELAHVRLDVRVSMETHDALVVVRVLAVLAAPQLPVVMRLSRHSNRHSNGFLCY